MIQNNINKFLQYDGEYAKKWLVDAVYITIKLNRNNSIINKIFKLSQIEIDIDTFLLEIEAYLQLNTDINYDKKRSPTELTNFINTWVYYSIFLVFPLKDIDKKNHRKYQLITRMALEFHYYYLKYITIVDENSRINTKSLEYAALTVVRVIEILRKIAQKKSAYLTEKYFPKNMDDLFVNFINIIKDDYVEKECLFIKKDPDRKDKILIKYENPHIGIIFQLLPSRKLSRGSSKTSEGNQEDENHNIIDYLSQGYLDYQKIVNIERGKGAKNNKSKIKGRLLDQVTQEERLLTDTIDQVPSDNEETLEEDMHKDPRVRASLGEATKVIPDQYKQRMIHRMVSSSIARQNQMLNSAYEIPPIENLSIVIKHLASFMLDIEFSKKNLYLSVFLLSIVLGREYQDILELLIKEKSNGCIIKVDKKLLTVKLDDKLFGSSIENFSVKNGKNISFNLPTGIITLYEYIQKQILSLPEASQGDLYKNEKQYLDFVDKVMVSCPSHVNLDLKNTWKILVVYSKNLFENNIASLFCIGKYTTLDRAELSYTSTHKSGQIHSHFINDIHNKLGIQKCINHLFGINKTTLNEEYLFDKKMEYVGSNRLITREEIKKFFSHMRRAMLNEDDQTKYFNLYAIYARYALSLLLATRYGKVSCNLEEISFELSLIRIIEKADDKQSGVRFIPLCKQVKSIIIKYKSLCSDLGFRGDNIYFLKEKKRHILYGENKNMLVNIFKRGYGLDQYILDFIRKVPLNFGRHVVGKGAVEKNFNIYYLQTMKGHYTKGTEQLGIVSTTDSQDYIFRASGFFERIGKEYGI